MRQRLGVALRSARQSSSDASPFAPTVISRKPARFRGGDEIVGMFGIGIDHRRHRLPAPLRVNRRSLAVEVLLEGRMIIHMVAGDVGEARPPRSHAIQPVLIQPVAGGLHRQMIDAVLLQLAPAGGESRPDPAWCGRAGSRPSGHHADRAQAGRAACPAPSRSRAGRPRSRTCPWCR